MDINELLSLTQDRAGSDLHLSSGNPPMLRVDGEIRPLGPDHLTGEAIESMAVSSAWRWAALRLVVSRLQGEAPDVLARLLDAKDTRDASTA